jgi:hypothetical protein
MSASSAFQKPTVARPRWPGSHNFYRRRQRLPLEHSGHDLGVQEKLRLPTCEETTLRRGLRIPKNPRACATQRIHPQLPQGGADDIRRRGQCCTPCLLRRPREHVGAALLQVLLGLRPQPCEPMTRPAGARHVRDRGGPSQQVPWSPV